MPTTPAEKEPIHIDSWIPTTVKVFYNDQDIELQISVKKLTSGERDAFEIWQQMDAFPPSDRQLLPKQGEEGLKQTVITNRRIAEMSVDERKEFANLLTSERTARTKYYRDMFSKFLRVVPGQLTINDAATASVVDVSTGEQFFDAFEHSEQNMVNGIHAIHYTSAASPEVKKALRSLADSASTSRPQQKAATGREPAKTADGAEPNGSAPKETAPAPIPTTSSSTVAH